LAVTVRPGNRNDQTQANATTPAPVTGRDWPVARGIFVAP
jgi:hypothetical protein